MNDELLARRVLALEERIEKLEERHGAAAALDAIGSLNVSTADRFDRLDTRLERMESRLVERLDAIDRKLDALLARNS